MNNLTKEEIQHIIDALHFYEDYLDADEDEKGLELNQEIIDKAVQAKTVDE